MELKSLFVIFIIHAGKFCTAGPEQLITKCRSDDAECIKANTIKLFPIFVAGMPEYGVETMDPFFLDHTNASKLDLEFFVYNATIKGLKDCIPLDVHRDVAKSKLHISLDCPVMTSEGQYELSGKMLALDVHGGGPVSCVLHPVVQGALKMHTSFNTKVNAFMLGQVQTHVVMDIEVIVGKDSKKYFSVTKFKYTLELQGKSNVFFENLFQNNKALSKAASDVINNSGNEIVREIGDPIFQVTAASAVKNINSFFSKIPIEELSLD